MFVTGVENSIKVVLKFPMKSRAENVHTAEIQGSPLTSFLFGFLRFPSPQFTKLWPMAVGTKKADKKTISRNKMCGKQLRIIGLHHYRRPNVLSLPKPKTNHSNIITQFYHSQKNFNQTHGKVIETVLLDRKMPLLIDFMPPGTTTNCEIVTRSDGKFQTTWTIDPMPTFKRILLTNFD